MIWCLPLDSDQLWSLHTLLQTGRYLGPIHRCQRPKRNFLLSCSRTLPKWASKQFSFMTSLTVPYHKVMSFTYKERDFTLDRTPKKVRYIFHFRLIDFTSGGRRADRCGRAYVLTFWTTQHTNWPPRISASNSLLMEGTATVKNS